MPIISVDAARLNELLGREYAATELSEALEQIGCDVEDIIELRRYRCPSCQAMVEGGLGTDTVKVCPFCGHSQEASFEHLDDVTAIRLDLLAARPDLFDVGGLARALKGYLGLVRGLPRYEATPSDVVVEVDASVADERSYRPYIHCAVVHIAPLDDATLAVIMKMQEALHWGVGRDRKLASIGVYDLETLRAPIHYRTLDPDGEHFVPLGVADRAMSGRQILEEHPKGTAYAHLLKDLARYPVLADAEGQVLSMPPIINSESTKVRVGSQRLFIDVTGVSEAAVRNSLSMLVSSLVELGGRVESVEVRAGGRTLVTPELSPKTQAIELARAKQWLGLPLDADSLVDCLERMRVDVRPLDAERTRFEVTYPAFRSDIRHMVDLFEDLAIGFGYQNIEPAMVPTMTVSVPRPEEARSELARQVMFGLGYSEVMSLPLTTEAEHFTRLRLPVPEHYPRIANPKIKALTVLRTHLMSGVLNALHENRRRPLPIRLFEMDNVARLDADGPNGTGEDRRLCFADIGPDAGYAVARANLDALLREMGVTATYAPVEHPTFTPGRAARFEAKGVSGLIGELHPEVVLAFGLDHPVSLVEVTLLPIEVAAQRS